ncbi:MAG: c-type cytochrome [Burkholderiales bacterium]
MTATRSRFLTGVVVGAAAMLLAVAGPEARAAEAAAGRGDPAKAESIANQVCAACHAADGNSLIPANPILAGQIADYTAKQLADFKSGKRKSAVMMGMISSQSAEDMRNLAAFYAKQKPKARTAKDAALAKQGQAIYRGGIMAKGVAACSSCHSPNGAGLPAQFPRLAGQHTEYTIAQLQAFRSGERSNDPNQMMRAVAARLSDQEIKAVAEYLAGLR